MTSVLLVLLLLAAAASRAHGLHQLQGGVSVRPRLPEPQLLALRGGTTTDEQTVSFTLINLGAYAALYKGMTTVGGINFINLTCGLVWVMWMLASDLCKSTVEDVLERPEEYAAALVKGVLNVSTVDDDDGDPFLKSGDITEVHVERGESMIIPDEMLLLDCDNGIDWRRMKQGVTAAGLLKTRGELVTVRLVDEKTYIARKQHRDGGGSDRMGKDLFRAADYETLSVRRGEPFTFPSNKFLAHCDNGLPGAPRNDPSLHMGDNFLESVPSYAQLKSRRDTVTLYFVPDTIFSKRLTQPETPRRSDRAIDRLFNRCEAFMEAKFLTPNVWRKLRTKPIALFGGVFSHMDVEHILANYCALQRCGPLAESVLGTARFAHLYLTSALMSQLVVCLWSKHLRKKAGGPSRAPLGLGASGAISGVMAWWSIELVKRGQYLVFGDRKVSPLLFWALYVAIDATGLLRLGAAQKLLTAFLQQLTATNGGKETKDEVKAEASRPRGEVGYDAHLGGALAGVLWQAPSLLWRVHR